MIFFKAVTIIFFSIACNTISHAQQRAPKQVRELRKLLVFLEEYSGSDYPDLDIDSVAYQARSMLASFLKSQASIQYSIDTLPNLRVAKSMDDKVKIYNFSYFGGGSVGSIDFSVIQWKNSSGSSVALELYKKGYGGVGFYSVHKIKKYR